MALGVAAALVGVHVSIGERADFLRRSGGCAPLCDPVELQDLERRAHTVYGLAAGLGVVLAVDVGLWIDALLKERRLRVGPRSPASPVRQRL